jgi:multidrug efflux pump subunit AcrB
MAVVFAMLASYTISRILTPITIGLLLRKEHERQGAVTGWLDRFHAAFNARFDRFRDFYGWMLTGILRHRILTPAVAAVVVIGAGVLAHFVGTDFFPSVDAGLIQLHVRAPAEPGSSAPSRFPGYRGQHSSSDRTRAAQKHLLTTLNTTSSCARLFS